MEHPPDTHTNTNESLPEANGSGGPPPDDNSDTSSDSGSSDSGKGGAEMSDSESIPERWRFGPTRPRVLAHEIFGP